MSVFKHDKEVKRMIFNVDSDIADRIDLLRDEAKNYGKRLDVDTAVNKGLEKFLKKAEKKLEEMRHEAKAKKRLQPADLVPRPGDPPALPGEKALAERTPNDPAVPTPGQIAAKVKENPILGDPATPAKK
ncbi:hypothetical protein [Desulfolutivibrio sulfoxidireducens]|uniref:hypothetical protein n=1 Tax=Desulfolutivibrio sulfoxidireducens TaxID=2773299 RepID=UPI00159D8D6A|nr:hypothetical protein [Desulfolutivibrio sulfoxidireducens]QLA15018.1 hypothetical protein GD605_02085 [Desulfolutivibrio sulfoxidireducens]QLA18585.1 hypothetical protein GD604_01995 [Desulfolutivibrio sulfoxidireducens]